MKPKMTDMDMRKGKRPKTSCNVTSPPSLNLIHHFNCPFIDECKPSLLEFIKLKECKARHPDCELIKEAEEELDRIETGLKKIHLFWSNIMMCPSV